MNELFEYLKRIITTCFRVITFSGDIVNTINIWLVKGQNADHYEMCNTEPFLQPTGRFLMSHELGFYTQEDKEKNWRWRSPYDWGRYMLQYSPILDDFDLNKDMYIHAVSAIYCEEEHETMIFCTSITPISIWINGQLVHTSSYDYFVKEITFVYKFKKGLNIILIEKPYFSRHKEIKNGNDDFVLTLKPYDFCASKKNNYFFDLDAFDKMKDMYSIIQTKTIYDAQDKVEVLVLPRYYEVDQIDEEVTICAYDDKGQLQASTDTVTSTKVELDIDPMYRGIIKITANLKNKKSLILVNYVVIGDIHTFADEIITIAKNRKDCNDDIVYTVNQLVNIPNTKVGIINGSFEMVHSRLYYVILSKLYDFVQYVHSEETEEIRQPLDVYNVLIPNYYRIDIDDDNYFYYTILPKNYDPKKQYPVFVFIEYGVGLGRYPYAKDYAIFQDFEEVIYVQLCARGGQSRDFISECSIFHIIDEITKQYKVDRDRIYVVGSCTGAMRAFSLAIEDPGLFAAVMGINGTIRTNLDNPNYEQFSNYNTLSVNHTYCVQDINYNGANVADCLARVQNVNLWTSPYYAHDDFNDAQNSNITIKELLKHTRNPYPKKLEYTTYAPIFNRCHWVRIDYIIELTEKSTVKAEILSPSRICIESTNVGTLSVLLNKSAMELNEDCFIIVDGQEFNVKIYEHTKCIFTWNRENISLEIVEVSEEQLLGELNAIAINESLLGIKQLYYNKCQIIYSNFYNENKDSSINRLIRVLNMPIVERAKNYKFTKAVEDKVDAQSLAESNFIYFASLEEQTELLKQVLSSAGCKITKDQLEYNGLTFMGDTFAIIRCENPYDREKYALLVIYNNNTMIQELLNIWDQFDANSLFYSNAIVYNQGKYYSFRN